MNHVSLFTGSGIPCLAAASVGMGFAWHKTHKAVKQTKPFLPMSHSEIGKLGAAGCHKVRYGK